MTQPVRPSDGPTVHLIPHTHWDREWYLPLALFQARLVPVIDAALDMLERDPDQRVTLDGQTVLLEDYLTLRPEPLECGSEREAHTQSADKHSRSRSVGDPLAGQLG